MKPIITINQFDSGIVADPTIPANGGQAFINLNIHKENSILQVSQALTQETDVFKDLVKWIVKDDNEVTDKYWALGNAGNLYKSVSIGGTWSLSSNVGGAGQGLIVYNGGRYYATATSLSGATSHTIDTATYHPMAIYLGSLWIGCGRYLAKLESDGVFTARDLTLPAGNQIKTIDVYGDRLVVGTYFGTNVYDQAESYLFTYDGTADFPEQSFYLEECGQNALISWENILLDFAGIGGNVYAFNNAFLDKAKQIPDIQTDTGDYAYVEPGAVAQYGGNILAGVSIGSGSALGGIWEFGRKNEDMPFAMTMPYVISTGSTDVEIGAIMTGGANRFLASWKDGTDYGLDALDTSAKMSMGYFESQHFEVVKYSHKELVKGVGIVAEPLPSKTSVVVKYKVDDASTFTTAGTITSSNQNEPITMPVRAKVIQIRLELNTSGNTTPKIKAIQIF